MSGHEKTGRKKMIGISDKSKCCNKPVKEIWRGLKLFHRCTSCGRDYEVGRIVYYQEPEEINHDMAVSL